MKKILLLLSVLFLTFGCYDDSDIRSELRDHEERIAQLETLCKQMNTNISALQTIVSTLQKNVFVTAVIPIKEGSDIVGYTISFSNSESVTIYHGRDGVDGEDGTDGADGVNGTTPSIGVRQDIDGIYYWTLDGEWLLDATGKKVQAVGRDGSDGAAGEDGKTPLLKIENGYWYVSYDGEKWTQLGKATGESANLIGITQDDKNVYFTLTDGTVISIPKGNGGSQDDEEGGAEDGSQTISKGPITLSLGEVTATTATFTARLDIDMMADYQEVGLVYSKDDNMDVESETITKVKINKESYSETFTGLQYDTDFYYTVYTLRNNVYSYGATQTFKTKDVTISVDDVNVTYTTATFIGKVVRDEADASVKVGIQYSKASSFESTSSLEVTPKEDGAYNVTCDGLYIATEYYYRTYVCQDGVYEYSKAVTFTTEKVSVTIEVESIDKNVVTFKGNVQFSEAGVIEIGVQYYPKSTTSQSAGIQTKAITEISENGDFIVEISGLLLGTEYYWQYYLLQDDVTIVGLPQIFEIADLYNVQSDLNISSASDLSSSASANCYIISNSGLYKFKPVKGNSESSVGNVASASILWETFGTSTTPECLDLISGICYKDGYIAFQTADIFKEGNAVIAAKGASGTILWSWHIWFTDQPQAQVYKNDAGTMMDRNLGATSATPGDVGALGLLYQWGRKDPFLGSSSISETVVAKSTLTWPAAVETNSSVGTVDYVTANPTTFVTADSFSYFDWHYSSRDNTLWTTSDKTKSIYDPCPAGWRVPDGSSNGIWSKAIGSSSSYNGTYDNANEGMNFSGKFGSASTIWYPASGYRNDYDGSPFDVGNYGYYWSASPYSHLAYYLYFNNRGYVDPSYYGSRAVGQSVRCLQVIDEVAGANAEESK